MRLSLRARIFAACLAVGSGASVFFGGLALVLLEVMEFEQIDLVLDDEIARFAAVRARDPQAPGPSTSFIHAWAAPLSGLAALPEEVRGLQPGAVEIDDDSGERRVAVRDVDGVRYVMAMDLSRMELWEDRAAGTVVLLVALCSLLSGLLGHALARRVVVPVTRLAERIDSSMPLGEPSDFATDTGDDEIGRLALALEDYARRIAGFAQREREFSAYVSHELRTPLSIISSSLELSRAAAPQSAGHALQRAADAAVDMRQTLEALLVLGRVQAGVARAESVDVAAIVREVIAAVESMPGACHGPIATHIQPSPTILELPGAVRIVVRNLVENACIHAPGARVDVSLAASVLTVRDYGPGIPVAEREHSLEGFVRGSAAMGEGAGLGLAIVQRLCERIGWTLTLEQTPGGGLTASVSFAR